MDKKVIQIVLACFMLSGTVAANDLSFPKTEKEIISLLSININKSITAPNGTKYIAEEGNVYKIINGKRFRLRGIQVVEALDVLPKAGALINFDFDSSKIEDNSRPLLDEFGKALKNGLPDSVILIAGHTDSKGPHEYNQNLSELRAKSVVEYLMISHRINPKRLLTKGFGETLPITNNDTEENRFKNRRVEFIRIE